MSLLKEAIQVLKHLPDTARHCPGQRVGIRQEEGPPIVGVITGVNYREGTVSIELEKDPEKRLTAPASQTTFIFKPLI